MTKRTVNESLKGPGRRRTWELGIWHCWCHIEEIFFTSAFYYSHNWWIPSYIFSMLIRKNYSTISLFNGMNSNSGILKIRLEYIFSSSYLESSSSYLSLRLNPTYSESDFENLNTKQYNHTEDTCVAIVCEEPKSHGGAIVITMMITACLTVIGFALAVRYRYYKYEARVSTSWCSRSSNKKLFRHPIKAPGMNLNYEGDTEQLDMRY